MSKALLIDGDNIVDITNRVQIITANDLESGEIKYRGNGIVIFRRNHYRGDAVVFLSYKNNQLIFGEWVDVYTFSDAWKPEDYHKYRMIAPQPSLHVISPIRSINLVSV